MVTGELSFTSAQFLKSLVPPLACKFFAFREDGDSGVGLGGEGGGAPNPDRVLGGDSLNCDSGLGGTANSDWSAA